MDLIKKVLILIIIFIASGCSVKYNLTINEDGSINETVVAKENTKKMESMTKLKGDAAINYLSEMFDRGDKDISITSLSDTYDTTATAVKVHKSIDDYANSFKSDVFENIKLTKENDEFTIETTQDKLLGNDSNYSLIYDEIEVNIKLPYVVTNNNADKVSGTTYTWIINKNTGLKNINISYKQGNKKNNINIKINDKTYNISYIVISLVGIALLILIIIFIVYRKNRKNNRM